VEREEEKEFFLPRKNKAYAFPLLRLFLCFVTCFDRLCKLLLTYNFAPATASGGFTRNGKIKKGLRLRSFLQITRGQTGGKNEQDLKRKTLLIPKCTRDNPAFPSLSSRQRYGGAKP
jgi:hypothetical protein